MTISHHNIMQNKPMYVLNVSMRVCIQFYRGLWLPIVLFSKHRLSHRHRQTLHVLMVTWRVKRGHCQCSLKLPLQMIFCVAYKTGKYPYLMKGVAHFSYALWTAYCTLQLALCLTRHSMSHAAVHSNYVLYKSECPSISCHPTPPKPAPLHSQQQQKGLTSLWLVPPWSHGPRCRHYPVYCKI